MKLRALLPVLAIAVAGLAPIGYQLAQPLPPAYASQTIYDVHADEGISGMQQLFDHDPTEAPDIAGLVRHYRVDGADVYVVSTVS